MAEGAFPFSFSSPFRTCYRGAEKSLRDEKEERWSSLRVLYTCATSSFPFLQLSIFFCQSEMSHLAGSSVGPSVWSFSWWQRRKRRKMPGEKEKEEEAHWHSPKLLLLLLPFSLWRLKGRRRKKREKEIGWHHINLLVLTSNRQKKESFANPKLFVWGPKAAAAAVCPGNRGGGGKLGLS